MGVTPVEAIAARVADVRARIARAAARAGRDPAAVTLVAVSKTQSAAEVRAAHAAGLRDFGENYAQEFETKMRDLSDLSDIRWHFIGHLQRNKARLVAGRAALVHTADGEAIIARLGRLAAAAGACQPILIQVNLSGEASKSGCREADLPSLVQHARRTPGVALRGLMTMPAPGDLVAARRCFARLRALAERHLPPGGPRDLSMGMSDDLEVAVEEGATLVRVGRAIFGPRRG